MSKVRGLKLNVWQNVTSVQVCCFHAVEYNPPDRSIGSVEISKIIHRGSLFVNG
jgi:hypothetical protein